MPSPITAAIDRLAIFPINKSRVAGLPPSLQEEIQGKLEAAIVGLGEFLPYFKLVERERLDVAFKELAFQASGSVRDDTFVGAGRMLGADHVLIYQTSVEFSSDATNPLPMYASDATQFGLIGGSVHGRTFGKIIQVETGAVVFQQTAEIFASYPRPEGQRYWSKVGLDAMRHDLALGTLSGFFTSLSAAIAPFPDGFSAVTDPRGRVMIFTVLIGGPAHNAGLQEGDIIKAIDGISVKSMSEPIYQNISDWKPRAPYTITVERDGSVEKVTISKATHRVRDGSALREPSKKSERFSFP